jgi:hypothetical protein
VYIGRLLRPLEAQAMPCLPCAPAIFPQFAGIYASDMRHTAHVRTAAAAAVAAGICAAPAAGPGDAATYRLSAAPVASFFWYPRTPRVRETVTLVSTSMDLTSPIVRFAWDVSDNGPFAAFVPGGPTATASFTTPAPHAVRLRVTNGEGLSTVATATIQMTAAPAGLIAPFPIVRIVGSRTRTGVQLRLLAVRAPKDAVIAIACASRGCPRALRRIRATAGGQGSRSVVFRRYARHYTAGATIVVRVTKPGVIGAYTAFAVRRHRIPLRTDACLAPGGGPAECPS